MGDLGQVVPAINYHWQSQDYLTIWNADKHVNDPGGYGTGFGDSFVDLPGYFNESTDEFGDHRGAWSTLDMFLTYKPAGNDSWYAQAYVYNLTNELIPYWRAVEAGNPSGSFSAPKQYGVRVGYYW